MASRSWARPRTGAGAPARRADEPRPGRPGRPHAEHGRPPVPRGDPPPAPEGEGRDALRVDDARPDRGGATPRGERLRPEDGRPDRSALDAAAGDRGHGVLDRRSSRGIHAPSGAKAAGLTDREIAILTELASGKSNDEIAKELWVTQQTVKFHLTNVYRKLGAKNRADAVRQAYQLGLIQRPLGDE